MLREHEENHSIVASGFDTRSCCWEQRCSSPQPVLQQLLRQLVEQGSRLEGVLSLLTSLLSPSYYLQNTFHSSLSVGEFLSSMSFLG
jgi:hypothetical protein